MKLQELRESRRLSQEALAQILDVSADAISCWELGKRYPSYKNGLKLKEYFDVQFLEQLFDDVNEVESVTA